MIIKYTEDLDKLNLKLHSQPYIFSYGDKENSERSLVYFDNKDDYFNLIAMDKDLIDKHIYNIYRSEKLKVIVKYILNMYNMKMERRNLINFFDLDFSLEHEGFLEKLLDSKEDIRNSYRDILSDKLLTGEYMQIVEQTVTCDLIIKNIKRQSHELFNTLLNEFDTWWEELSNNKDNDKHLQLIDECEECFENVWFSYAIIGNERMFNKLLMTPSFRDSIVTSKENGKFMGFIHVTAQYEKDRFNLFDI